ncbi:MAG: galactose-1-epimerase, partial [Shewanella sp.]
MQAFLLTNDLGVRARILDFGATLTEFGLPVAGRYRNVVLNCEDIDYPQQQAYLGAVVGRFANRIAHSRLLRDGNQWALKANEGTTCLHGGPDSLHNRHWDVVSVATDALTLQTTLVDGEQGFPGSLDIVLTYRLESTDLVIELRASSDAATPVNLTSHAYFNLDGQPSDVREHHLMIAADHYLPIDSQSIPYGVSEIEPAFDFRRERPIGQEWLSHPQQLQVRGYDHCFALRVIDEQPAVVLTAGDGLLRMEMYTNQPGVQLYTGNWLAGTPARQEKKWENY